MGAGWTRSRGQPVVALLAVLCGWVGGRLSAWDTMPSFAAPMTRHGEVAKPVGGDVMAGPQTPPGGFGARGDAMDGWQNAADWPRWTSSRAYPFGAGRTVFVTSPGRFADEALWHRLAVMLAGAPPVEASSGWIDRGSVVEGDPGREFPQAMMGAVRHDRFPEGFSTFQAPAAESAGWATPGGGPSGERAPEKIKPRRWSADAWALLRGNGAGPLANGALPATYGASQAGAILRYRLALLGGHRPEVYMRSTATLQQIQSETAAAIGLSARPLTALPVITALEMRLTEQAGQRRVQPVAMAITALPPFPLPGGLRGEAYAQAGYVAGKYATPFAEGQMRADHGLFRLGAIESRIGGGVWGGIQKGASRIDAGPSAIVTLPLKRGVNARVGVDWRFRVAGDAEPGSGPAVTLSAGF